MLIDLFLIKINCSWTIIKLIIIYYTILFVLINPTGYHSRFTDSNDYMIKKNTRKHDCPTCKNPGSFPLIYYYANESNVRRRISGFEFNRIRCNSCCRLCGELSANCTAQIYCSHPWLTLTCYKREHLVVLASNLVWAVLTPGVRPRRYQLHKAAN